MAVSRRQFVGSGAVAAAAYLARLDRAAAARKPRRRVFARPGVAQGVGAVGLTVVRTRVLEGGTQSAVALTPADGETISGSTQSNFQSNGFWGRSGFTRAEDWTGTNPLGADYAGFDDPNFLPIVTWLTDFGGTGFYSRMDDLGLNGMLPCAGSISLANNITFEKWAVVTDASHAGGTIGSSDDPGVIGVSTGEEPSTIAGYDDILSAAATWLGSSDGPGRMHLFNFADNLLNGDIEDTYFPDDMVIAGDWTTCDQYWFAGAPNDAAGSQTKLHSRLYTPTSGSATTTQCARGSHYGSMMDSIRKNYPGGSIAPIGVWIENGAPYTEAASAAITPAQLKWAVWATIVHGARSIHYFNHTFRSGDPLASANNFNNDGYGGPGVGGTGIYAAAKEVNLRALALAPVINSPFDGYFVYGDTESAGSIATSGFLTAVTSTNSRSKYAGVDACCKWHPTSSKHYIFATTREAEASTNIPVTFRMVDQGQTTATEVHESNPISIERGGGIPGGFCEFDDTFANAATYKTYRID
jgi:hypothetical protein